mmetsp:Transcript_29240/g.67314  ORF Transcript_29240/g.67314 Transcript_29240/m.67314 type:complete len:229 (-) Transcript_29240:164-850(-)
MAVRSARLASLLKGFGLCPVELAQMEPKKMMSSLRSEYFRRAKETHPDLASESTAKEEASKNFVLLRERFEEAQKLIENGVVPSLSAAQTSFSSSGSAPFRDAQTVYYYHPSWNPSPKPVVEFDSMTKLKGRLLVFSVALALCAFLKEFGAAFAGISFSWHPGTSVRRWDSCPSADAAEVPKAPIVRQDTRERGVDSFYQKRGVSNTRKKYVPRGHEKVTGKSSQASM